MEVLRRTITTEDALLIIMEVLHRITEEEEAFMVLDLDLDIIRVDSLVDKDTVGAQHLSAACMIDSLSCFYFPLSLNKQFRGGVYRLLV